MDESAMILVKEFVRKISQGYANAALCRGEDGRYYVVKTRRGAGRDTVVKEWLCGRVGRELQLPIPDIEQVYFGGAGAKHGASDELLALTESAGFGSHYIESADEVVATDIPFIEPKLRARIALFDWWIVNGDCTDWNPNLLWSASRIDLHVIDHNLAFGNESSDDFWCHHIFRDDRKSLSDPDFRAQIRPSMDRIIHDLPRFWAELPEDWTDLCNVTLAQVDSVLRRCEHDAFWDGR
ncbi:MAG TPA: HipA family kinase [Tepidisphaeraceae bacterium]|nr:HipA family kinase [Tepidisphaeraceae bacterium]